MGLPKFDVDICAQLSKGFFRCNVQSSALRVHVFTCQHVSSFFTRLSCMSESRCSKLQIAQRAFVSPMFVFMYSPSRRFHLKWYYVWFFAFFFLKNKYTRIIYICIICLIYYWKATSSYWKETPLLSNDSTIINDIIIVDRNAIVLIKYEIDEWN